MENSKSYKKRIKLHTPPSSLIKDCTSAFFSGGLICLIGEMLIVFFKYLGMDEETSYTALTFFLILIAAILTAIGVFDKIARFAGAGTLVPVTGFANSVVSPAIDTKSEGFVLGVGAKIFTVAGPVILYGSLSGVLYGIIYYVITLLSR